MKEDVVKHLEIIQGVIGRMANNSFLLKGWAITIVAALFALAARDTNPSFALLALFPALAFWGLDAYYLRQERLYRRLYEAICHATEEELRSIRVFSLDTTKYRRSTHSWFRTLWSPTVVTIHGVIAALVVIVIIVMLVIS